MLFFQLSPEEKQNIELLFPEKLNIEHIFSWDPGVFGYKALPLTTRRGGEVPEDCTAFVPASVAYEPCIQSM